MVGKDACEAISKKCLETIDQIINGKRTELQIQESAAKLRVEAAQRANEFFNQCHLRCELKMNALIDERYLSCEDSAIRTLDIQIIRDDDESKLDQLKNNIIFSDNPECLLAIDAVKEDVHERFRAQTREWLKHEGFLDAEEGVKLRKHDPTLRWFAERQGVKETFFCVQKENDRVYKYTYNDCHLKQYPSSCLSTSSFVNLTSRQYG